MSRRSIKFCALCGDFGAEKALVEGSEFSASFNLCPECDEMVENYDIKGKTRTGLLDQALRAPMCLNGPKSYAVSELRNGLRERTNWGLLNICHKCNRKMDMLIQIGAEESVDEPGCSIKITPEIKSVLPKEGKEGGFLCEHCIKEFLVKMVEKNDLPSDYQIQAPDGTNWDSYTEFIKDLINRKAKGLPLIPENNVEKSPQKLSCLNISIMHLTARDLELFSKDGEFDYHKGEVKEDINPLFVSPYDHGFIIQISDNNDWGLQNFGYSKELIAILKWATEKYDMLRFDTVGPVYKEFPLP